MVRLNWKSTPYNGPLECRSDETLVYRDLAMTIQQSYLRVLMLWVVVLAALFAFQEYFS